MVVTIQGAVTNPGEYLLDQNATTSELVAKAQALPQADLSQLSMKRKLIDGETLHIPEKINMIIYVEGAVRRPVELSILSGTRCREIADQIEFSDNADIAAFKKKKRYLKPGEKVLVPFKKKGQRPSCKKKKSKPVASETIQMS